jgi:ATP-dependent Clp protease ATP-binding subunit ClpC
MFERFTDRARRVVVVAQEEARMLNHDYIGTEHILLGLIHEGKGVAAKALESLGISLEAVRQQVEEIIGRGQHSPSGHIPFTPRAKKVLELSLRESQQLGHNYIGTEHILLGLIREGEGVAAQVLVRLGADLNRVRQQVIQLLHDYRGEAASGPTAGEIGAAGEGVVRRRAVSREWRMGDVQSTLAKMAERIEAIEQVLGMRQHPPGSGAPPAKAESGTGEPVKTEADTGEPSTGEPAKAEAGSAEAGSAEAGSAEAGSAEAGRTESTGGSESADES